MTPSEVPPDDVEMCNFLKVKVTPRLCPPQVLAQQTARLRCRRLLVQYGENGEELVRQHGALSCVREGLGVVEISLKQQKREAGLFRDALLIDG